MFSYSDYYNPSEASTPYTSSQEHIGEWMLLVDMLLERMLQSRINNDEIQLPTHGLGMRSVEAGMMLITPPFMRPREYVDYEVVKEVKKAIEHIDSRVKATDKKVVLTFFELCESFELNLIEKIAVILAFQTKTDLRMGGYFSLLASDEITSEPTAGLMHDLAVLLGEDVSSIYGMMSPVGRPSRLLFTMSSDGGSTKGLSQYIRLQSMVFAILAGQKISLPKGLRESMQIQGKTPFFEKEKKQMSNAKNFGVFIVTSDAASAEFVAKYESLRRKRKLYVLEYSDIPEESFEEWMFALAFWLIYTGANLLITDVSKNSSSTNSLGDIREMVVERLSEDRLMISGSEGVFANMGTVNIEQPEYKDRVAMWKYFLGKTKTENVDIEELADCYETPFGLIKSAAEHALLRMEMSGEKKLSYAALIDSITENDSLDFEGKAVLIPAVYTWDDIEMKQSQKEVLEVACRRYMLRNRIGDSWGLKRKNAYGNGVSILLYGPPGTGKTMASQVIAREVGLPLYRVDLSQIFSKYIGETEKHLSKIFDEAKKANIILFFDEADALFSKRTEVSDSHDKYANTETSYLLQKMEEYGGMSILATNYYGNFDSAFMRRITYSAHLESPDENARYKLWCNTLPKETPVDESIDFRFFAKQFEISPANIKSILYSAAFMAAADKKSVSAEHIVKAIVYEYAKLGKMVSTDDFGPYGGFAIMARG